MNKGNFTVVGEKEERKKKKKPCSTAHNSSL